MTGALSSKSSKRKVAKSRQEVALEDSKENSPSILSQLSLKQFSPKNKCHTASKENISPRFTSSRRQKLPSANTNTELYSPIRKSQRRTKTLCTDQRKPLVENQSARNVLCDKTNSSIIRENKSNEQTCVVLKTIENKKNIFHKIIADPKLYKSHSSTNNHSNNDNHLPVYRTVDPHEFSSKSEVPPEKKENVYEFEVDENEEPNQRKKRKKRAYKRKPKIGPKALTINNIKYNSSENIALLPAKPVAQIKRTTKAVKSNLKPYSSVTNLYDSQDSCYSVKSFMSHPPLLLCENKNLKSKRELSTLQETQSEQSQSPIHHYVHFDAHLHLDLPSNRSSCSVTSPSNSHDVYFSPNPRCSISSEHHPANHSCQNTCNNSFPRQDSSGSTNISSTSPSVFLSSTPCKRLSHIVYNNSVFDHSHDLPQGLRLSMGLIEDGCAVASVMNDKCFGFDQPEELEEPLLSPIKRNIDPEPNKAVKLFPKEIHVNQAVERKPTIKEVIAMLKATIPKSTKEEKSEVYGTSPESSNPSSPKNEDKETAVHFKKPPRRSYERQRRIQHHNEDEEEDDEKNDEEKENSPKAMNKVYKKKTSSNTTKTAKPAKVTKARQKIAKEEEEIERLAAQMNAQFQEIDKVNLVVE